MTSLLHCMWHKCTLYVAKSMSGKKVSAAYYPCLQPSSWAPAAHAGLGFGAHARQAFSIRKRPSEISEDAYESSPSAPACRLLLSVLHTAAKQRPALSRESPFLVLEDASSSALTRVLAADPLCMATAHAVNSRSCPPLLPLQPPLDPRPVVKKGSRSSLCW